MMVEQDYLTGKESEKVRKTGIRDIEENIDLLTNIELVLPSKFSNKNEGIEVVEGEEISILLNKNVMNSIRKIIVLEE